MLRTTLWGILALAPIAAFVYLFVHAFVSPFVAPAPAPEGTFLGDWWWAISGASIFLIIIVFLVHAMFNGWVPRDKRTLWVALIFFGNVYVIPFYWWHYIRGRG
ncbi:MAG: hypothetical protein O7B27_01315 [Gammaproteobacteria bacterium]|jgi:hypothetical protein|nr:hypothetical protein [Gammaproteobacteria bacterium]